MRGVGFAASIRTSSTRREANPWASENRSLSAKKGRGEDGASLSSWGASRTYNKLKSHHPRDLVAITPASLGGGRERPASVRRSFLATADDYDDNDDDRNNDRARAR